jgi:hypothetical protein
VTIKVHLCDKKDFAPSVIITPSDRIYFGEYPYRVDIDGPQHPDPRHDPMSHWLVSDIMRSSGMYWKRERKSKNRRSIYLGTYDDVKWLCNVVPVPITRILGPVSYEHVSLLNSDDTILRQGLFYGKYNYRTELTFWTHVGTNRKPVINEIMDFVFANFSDYRWGHRAQNWFYNYLYCNKEEWEELELFINIAFGKYIREKKQVSLLSEL